MGRKRSVVEEGRDGFGLKINGFYASFDNAGGFGPAERDFDEVAGKKWLATGIGEDTGVLAK